MKYIIKENRAIVFIDNEKLVIEKPTSEQINTIISGDEAKIRNLLKKDESIKKNEIEKSKILISRGCSVYMKNVSEVSLPEDFTKKILIAEKYNDAKRIEKYKNFWTLVSMNPDARVRNNMFWFIRKWDMSISKAGFIIAYRNVDIVKKSEYDTKEVVDLYYKTKYVDNKDPNIINYKGNTLENVFQSIIFGNMGDVYTDNHSHTFTIRLGQVVEMPREQCDSEQENSCSRGLVM